MQVDEYLLTIFGDEDIRSFQELIHWDYYGTDRCNSKKITISTQFCHGHHEDKNNKYCQVDKETKFKIDTKCINKTGYLHT